MIENEVMNSVHANSRHYNGKLRTFDEKMFADDGVNYRFVI